MTRDLLPCITNKGFLSEVFKPKKERPAADGLKRTSVEQDGVQIGGSRLATKPNLEPVDNRGTFVEHSTRYVIDYNHIYLNTALPKRAFAACRLGTAAGVPESFPELRYSPDMRPAAIKDPVILALIQELAAGTELPSGAAVRRELRARFGSRGGVTRIYRLLDLERDRLATTSGPVARRGGEVTQQEFDAMRERAERAELRERDHQTYWQMEIDRLRMRLQELEPVARRTAQDPTVLLRQQLRAAEQRAAALEEQLLELLTPPSELDSGTAV